MLKKLYMHLCNMKVALVAFSNLGPRLDILSMTEKL